MKHKFITATFIPTLVLIICALISCSRRGEKQGDEQISVSSADDIHDSLNSVTGNVTMKQISTFPSKVILTGLNEYRLVSIYKSRTKTSSSENMDFSRSSYDDDDGNGDESTEHFMPGIDILFGYNLLNIVHYDLTLEKVHFLFNHPVLIKTFYYPSFAQDSLNNQPINRNFYLVSVYDEDTNKDTLINRKDLRRFYHFDASGILRSHLIPPDYSAIRSQYDPKNDIMYIFARHDENKNGTEDKKEAVHIFWLSLKTPSVAKLLY